MKKILSALLALLLSVALFGGCGTEGGNNGGYTPPDDTSGGDDTTGGGDTSGGDENNEEVLSEEVKANLSANGYVTGKICDFSVYENTDAYRKVTTADEFLQAIVDAQYHYETIWDDDTKTFTQVPAKGYNEENFEGSVHVIEIANDLNLGYKKLSNYHGIVTNFGDESSGLSHSDMFKENGISQIKVENVSNLLIYSKNGAKLTHCGFKLTSDTSVVFRNLEFDEMWQWEDAPVASTDKIGDYDYYGWAYFKIAFCGYIWIDHCTFGKSYDGQIDYSNTVYNADAGTAGRAPYGADGGNGLHISWCNFNAGSDDKDGYLYKMMEKIEEDYQEYLAAKETNPEAQSSYLYYAALRDGGASFEDVLYGVAIPQKKGFLCGDGSNKEYDYNLKLQISFANCKFTNLEDRIPKVRGGNAYLYNCVVDSSEYYAYRTTLKNKNAATKVAAVNSTWKCALVSQAIVCGNGGSVKAENCIFRGIDYLLKNNDSGNGTTDSKNGGYEIVNCSYQKGAKASVYVGSSSDPKNKFTNSSTSILKTDLFAWHTADGTAPFTTTPFALEDLEEILANEKYGSGVTGSYLNLLKITVE